MHLITMHILEARPATVRTESRTSSSDVTWLMPAAPGTSRITGVVTFSIE